MFRKPKRGAKKGGVIRRRTTDDEGDSQQQPSEESTTELLSQARKRTRMMTSSGRRDETEEGATKTNVMHQYDVSAIDIQKRNADLVTSTSEHHPQQSNINSGTAQVGEDGIFRDKTRSRLLAGPVKITSHVRTTCRFDYQPDICKDYKETGFCGFGDTCIYLHDRGDTLSGWQLEQKWEEEQKRKKDIQEREIQGFLDGGKRQKSGVMIAADDGLPYACHICRKPFTSPVVTACAHYFCEKCIMNHVRQETESCPICSTDTHGVFNQPTKLIAKKRRVLGAAKASQPNSWELFAEALSKSTTETSSE